MLNARSSSASQPRRGQRRRSADTGQTHAGMGDQPAERTCPNGRPDCPGPNAPTGMLPCLSCLAEGGED